MSGIFFHLEGNITHPLKGKVKVYKNWLTQIAALENCIIKDIHFVFCDDEKILEINKQFLNHDYYTDIITFPYSQQKDSLKAEIYISIDTVSSNAETYDESFDSELKRVIAHGLLHMIGYNDKTEDDEKIMREKEDQCLNIFPE